MSQAWGLPKYVYSNQAPAHFCKPVEEKEMLSLIYLDLRATRQLYMGYTPTPHHPPQKEKEHWTPRPKAAKPNSYVVFQHISTHFKSFKLCPFVVI